MAKRNVETIPPGDAWAYTPEMIERHRRAQSQRGYRLSEEDLLEIIARADAARQEGREYHVSEAELEALEARHLTGQDGEAAGR